MLHRQPTLDQLKQRLRMEICQTCPFRAERTDDSGLGTPLPCEAKCPVFVHLPILKAAGKQIDPMIGSHERAVESAIQNILANAGEIDSEEACKECARGAANSANANSGVGRSNHSASNESDRNRLRRLRYHQKNLSKILGRLLNP